ncbi:MAG TPA: hypothetical protein VNL35_00095 [Chloroflexota bacterium]|nr:hypothetical protein [Chloroflexota bacterium]
MLSRCIEGLGRPHFIDQDNLVEEYRQATLDVPAENEAMDWIEAHVDEALD